MSEVEYRKLAAGCKEKLVMVPIHEVAKIATILLNSDGNDAAKERPTPKVSDAGKTALGPATTRRVNMENPEVAATAKAFELLEIAYYGKQGLADKGSYEAGLADFVERKKIAEDFLAAVESLPKWELEYDEQAILLRCLLMKA
jgi:hypothetical protein